MFSLKGKVAVITGSRRGIGKGIAEKLAEAGADVVISDISEEGCEGTCKEIEGKFNVKTLSVKCDVSKKSDADNLIAKTVEKFGRIDILVNNAGIFPFVQFLDMAESDWDKVLGINLKGVFLCSQAAAKAMKPGSKIISISSIAAFIGFQGLTHYCASKGGISGFTRALALELAGKKINVNAVAPGAIDTPGAKEGSTEESVKQTIAVVPWKRMGTSDDIASAVCYLASDEADYVTGQTLIVDGGWTVQ
jgi:3-oxoacyl-[acyl-carrier protein] reductase